MVCNPLQFILDRKVKIIQDNNMADHVKLQLIYLQSSLALNYMCVKEKFIAFCGRNDTSSFHILRSVSLVYLAVYGTIDLCD